MDRSGLSNRIATKTRITDVCASVYPVVSLNIQAMSPLIVATVANPRVHATTRRVANEAFA